MTMPCLLRAQRSLTGPAQAEPLPHTGHSAGPSARLSPGPWPWSRYHRARCCVTNKTLDLQQTEGCVGSTSVPGVSRKTKTKTIQGPRCGSWEMLTAAARGLEADTHWSSWRDTGSEGRPTPQSWARGLSASLSARTPDSTPNSGSSAQCKSLGAMCHREAGRAGEAARSPAEVPQGQPFREGGQGFAQRTLRCSEERHSGRHDATRLLLNRCSDPEEPKGVPWMKQLSRQKDGLSGGGEAEPRGRGSAHPACPASGRKGPAPSGLCVPACPPKDVRPSSLAGSVV